MNSRKKDDIVSLTECSCCHKPETVGLKKCNKCNTVAYCSRACRNSHFDVHKKECWKLAKRYNNNKHDSKRQVNKLSDKKKNTIDDCGDDDWKLVNKPNKNERNIEDKVTLKQRKAKGKNNAGGTTSATTKTREDADTNGNNKTKVKVARTIKVDRDDKNCESFSLLADDEEEKEDETDEEEGGVLKQEKPDKKSKTKNTGNEKQSQADKLYDKLGKALSIEDDKGGNDAKITQQRHKKQLSQSPISVIRNTRQPRTNLRKQESIFDLMNVPIVIHYDPKSCSVPTEIIDKLAGSYIPFDPDELSDVALHWRSVKDTAYIVDFFSKSRAVTKRRLAGKGIYINQERCYYPECTYQLLFHPKEKKFCIMDTRDISCLVLNSWDTLPPMSPYLVSSCNIRKREYEFWKEDDSLFWWSSEAFTLWTLFLPNGENHTVRVAMTPEHMFLRAINLASVRPKELPPPLPFRAEDFYFWDQTMVLHADPNGISGRVPTDFVDFFMGVYETVGEICNGYPVYIRNEYKSNSLAQSTSKVEGVQEYLESRSICLNSAGSGRSCLYMINQVLHVSPSYEAFKADPSYGYCFQGISKPQNEEDLLTNEDALFRLGPKAFSAWRAGFGGSWEPLLITMTPLKFFEYAVSQAGREVDLFGDKADERKGTTDDQEQKTTGISKKKKTSKNKKKKKKKSVSDETLVISEERETRKLALGDELEKKEESMDNRFVACACDRLSKEMGLVDSSEYQKRWPSDLTGNQNVDEIIQYLFDTSSDKAAWLLVSESVTAPIFETILLSDTKEKLAIKNETNKFLDGCVGGVLVASYGAGRKQDVISILKSAVVSTKIICTIFDKLPSAQGDHFNNELVRSTKNIRLDSPNDFDKILTSIKNKVGKSTRRSLTSMLLEAKKEVMARAQRQQKKKKSSSSDQPAEKSGKSVENSAVISQVPKLADLKEEKEEERELEKKINADEISSAKGYAVEELSKAIERSIHRYSVILTELSSCTGVEEGILNNDETFGETPIEMVHCEDLAKCTRVADVNLLSSEEAAAEMARCTKLSLEKQEEVVNQIEINIDLFNWEDEAEWTIDITEQAHKWFRKKIKRQRKLCERVIRRLKLLSTGRWPYVLCKPLKKTKKASVQINLYESKIDTASRIIWEVAVSFSPRRSTVGNRYCEQVIRVWDIVEDHDNLTRCIERTIDRIENSHMRGQQCVLYSELVDFDSKADMRTTSDRGAVIPRVFAMKPDVVYQEKSSQKKSCRHYPPATDDPRQFTLLKFYELDASAIKLILETKDGNTDLPFTPGPKEHEIIHHSSNPPKSILLMGRSGTGKTTCLVFRMWAQYMAYLESSREPRQLFVTKNDVLRNEVEKSFNNMGLTWRRQRPSDTSVSVEPQSTASLEIKWSTRKFPLFLTSSEWLEILDNELPGSCFFTSKELEQRKSQLREDDVVQRGVEALIADESNMTDNGKGNKRQEMSYSVFRRSLWRKINSRTKSLLDPAQVWLEIKSYIKGSVAALHLEDPERSQTKRRFLSREEYLALPRKQSRIDQAQRQEVYDLFIGYEKLKRQGNYFDEMDLVYNLAGRISKFYESELSNSTPSNDQKLLPIDSLFVDEVQDFTQAELYILTRLSRDPNNLMLAGDTAQSIAVGVGFRFSDVRQIFYNSFGGSEPDLLQLTHNYRSHAGVLRLAACVVELLYFFYSDSLDKLPPDLGLFDGPKPVIMEVYQVEDLVLMLDGSKRETSRIEFGAHQVVIVRNEEAKESLPDEFNVDRDWVMTVQQSKGLEFDDVLLYNFFTDSEAGDLWRVVSNYTEDDIEAYYADAKTAASGVQRYDWAELDLKETRHLEFNREQHKILETELKMLYTAITRARVNVFIAETDSDASCPMFNYFKRRCVVDVVDKQTTEGISGVRVFGNMSSADDWLKRGEYYLQNAEGSRRKGCLRLAAKCFDKIGQTKRRDHALAYLSFVEIEEHDSLALKRRAKHGVEQRQRLYSIASQLLETEDIGFLNKAGLCLLQAGDQERARSARMFELYARLSYAKRRNKLGRGNNATSNHEQQYFTYAAKLFARCASQQVSLGQRTDFLLGSFRNLICSATPSDFRQASELIEANLSYFSDVFGEITSLCTPSKELVNDPTGFFHSKIKNSEDCKCIRLAMKKLAKITCRSYYKKNDPVGLSAAIEAIPSRNERVEVLSNLDSDPAHFIVRLPWGRNSVFSGTEEKKYHMKKGNLDVTDLIVDQLVGDGHEQAAEVLEERGRLLEAAEHLSTLVTSHGASKSLNEINIKIAELKSRYLELVAASPGWEGRKDELFSLIETVGYQDNTTKGGIPLNVKMSMSMSRAKLSKTVADVQHALEACKNSVLWKCESIDMAMEVLGDRFLDQMPGEGLWHKTRFITNTILDLQRISSALQRRRASRSIDDSMLISQVNSYFELVPYKAPHRLSTKMTTNLRLRLALQTEGEETVPVLDAATGSRLLTKEVDPERVHSILARFICRKAVGISRALEKQLADISSRAKPCATVKYGIKCKKGVEKCSHSHLPYLESIRKYILVLQLHMVCLRTIKELRIKTENRVFVKEKLWDSLSEHESRSRNVVLEELVTCLMYSGQYLQHVRGQDDTIIQPKSNVIIWRESVVKDLKSYAGEHWYNLPLYKKKGHVFEIIRYWKLLHFCDPRNAYQRVEEDLTKVEKHRTLEGDLQKRKAYFINSKHRVKFKGGKFVSAEIVARMWLWAVCSVDEDIFNTITVVERLLKTTVSEPGLETLKKMDQIALLETNAVALFSAVSLRYSEIPSTKKFLCIIPEKSYLGRILSGGHSMEGFGKNIKDTLSEACHKHFFTGFFNRFVCHLEFIAGFIIDSDLLSLSPHPAPCDVDRFVRAVILSGFICCNAIALSLVGVEMTPEEAKKEINTIPKTPLCGKVMDLVKKLTASLSDCADRVSSQLENKFAKIGDKSSFWDLVELLDSILRVSGLDQITLCSVYQKGKDNVKVECVKDVQVVRNAMASIPLHCHCAIFADDSSKKFLTSTTRDYSTTEEPGASADDFGGLSRKADERTAAITISRYIIAWKNAPGIQVETHFQKWKNIMINFFRIVKDKAREKKKLDLPTLKMEPVTADAHPDKCPLGTIKNLWNDLAYVHSTGMQWKSDLMLCAPLFDDIQCEFCGIINNPPLANDRITWCQANYPYISYRQAAIHFNIDVLGRPSLESPEQQQHLMDHVHQQRTAVYNANIEAVSHLLARLERSIVMLESMISVCDGEKVSWYLNVGEEARSLLNELENSRGMLWEAGVNWPHTEQTLPSLLNNLNSISHKPQAFYSKMCEEEKNMNIAELKAEEEVEAEDMSLTLLEDDHMLHQ